jgi:hypothetical protein
VNRIEILVLSDIILDVRLIAEEFNMNKETARQIITEDSGMKNISAKMVLGIFTDDQKDRRLPGYEIHYKNGSSTFAMRFSALSRIKNALKGHRFADIPDIERNVTTLLRGIPENDFQDCFWQ